MSQDAERAGQVGPGSRRAVLPPRRLLLALLEGLFYLAYPMAVYYAHSRLETRALGSAMLALLGVALLIRLRGSLHEVGALLRQHAGILVLIGLAVALDERFFLLALPGLVSLYLLVSFGASLRRGPPMIERFARIIEDDLPDFTLPYCRIVTALWCGFFALNALAVFGLATSAPLSWWAIYNGLVFYLLVGAAMGGEFVFRKLWFRYYGGGLADLMLARLFPAERTANGRRSLAYDRARRTPAGAPADGAS